jgi:long-chain acyl-CoA synthetase
MTFFSLAHILEFIAQNTIMNFGGAIGYGSPRTLSDRLCKPCGDLKAVKPNTLFGVPRVFETLKKLTWEMVNDKNTKPIRKYLFNLAYRFKKHALSHGRQTPLLNKLIFSKVKQAIGGNTSVIMCGGAPLNPDTQEFMRICFDAVVCQGYGLTETGVVSVQRKNRAMTVRNVGQLSMYADVKLVSVPEMEYSVQDKPFARGEVVIRGEGVCVGYYKKPQLTNEVIKDGWFYSGDIGYIDEMGFLHIIDRKKNLIKLDLGEYVAIEKLEGVYQNSPFVSPNGIYVYADSSKSFCVANILPQMSYLKIWAKENGVTFENNTQLCDNVQVRKAVLTSLHEEAKKAEFSKFEYLGDIRLHADEWTAENGMLTAAMKHQRRTMFRKYEKSIQEMYDIK